MKSKKLSGKKRLLDLILTTARNLNMLYIVKNNGIRTIHKKVIEKMHDDIFGEESVDDYVIDSILEFAV